jgi:hypothetical protein
LRILNDKEYEKASDLEIETTSRSNGLQNKGDRSADLPNVSFAPQLDVALTVIV